MPLYDYRCPNGHLEERLEKITAPVESTCAVCGLPSVRVLRPAAIRFNGSGFYATDYPKRRSA
jgi:putative FmdB family regulatory protein